MPTGLRLHKQLLYLVACTPHPIDVRFTYAVGERCGCAGSWALAATHQAVVLPAKSKKNDSRQHEKASGHPPYHDQHPVNEHQSLLVLGRISNLKSRRCLA